MKKVMPFLLIFVCAFVLGVMFPAQPAHAGYVSGYYRNNGTYVSGYYRNTPSYASYGSDASPYGNPYSERSYPSYSSGLKYQSGYYKPSTGSYIQGHFKTYSDGNTWNNRKNLYGW